MNEIEAIFRYLLVVELISFSFWPWAFRLFPRFRDRGLAFSKTIGLLFLSFVTWWLSSIRVMRFDSSATLWVSAVLAIVAAASGVKTYQKLFALSREERRAMFLSEAVFIGAFVLWAYLRGFVPQISGLEKFMDHAFMLSALRTDFAPPLDPWLSGEAINYYYFGHWMAALLKRLTFVVPEIAYNLQMVTLFAMTAQSTFSLGSSLGSSDAPEKSRRAIVAGFLTLAFAIILGNSHTSVFWPIDGAGYWYPNATRFIYNTIHEFPIYSFVVNDLHGHVSNLPNVCLTIALLASMNRFGVMPFRIGFLVFSIGASFATNAWDFAFDLFLAGVFFLAHFANFDFRNLKKLSVLEQVAAISAVLLLGSIFLFLPFWRSLNPPSKGVEWVGSQTSPLWQLLVIWGAHFPIVVLLGYQLHTRIREQWFRFLCVLAVVALILVALPEFIYIKDIYPMHPRANTMFKFYYHAWILLAVIIGVGVPEMPFEKRFSFSTTVKEKSAALLRIAVPVICILSGLVCTIRTTTQGLRFLDISREGLDGLTFLSARLPDDWFAIRELNRAIDERKIDRRAVMLEATGDSYTDYGRISSFTGLQTVMGWSMHEWLWRGSFNEEIKPKTRVGERSQEIDTVQNRVRDIGIMYQAEKIEDLRTKLDLYGVKYIVVGTLERQKYPRLNEALIREVAPHVFFERGSLKIYEKN